MSKIKVSKKFKKNILRFCREFEFISRPRKIEITVPKCKRKITICWSSDHCVDILNDDGFLIDLHKTKEIKNYNKKIRKFCSKTSKFGKMFFKDKDWLWENILWEYYPENGEKFKLSDLKWG